MSTPFEAWLAQATASASVRAMAVKIDAQHTKLQRHLATSPPNPITVVAIARAYGASPVEGLVASGLITQEEALRADSELAVARLDDHRLMLEIMRRVDAGSGKHGELDEPVRASEEEMAHLRETTRRLQAVPPPLDVPLPDFDRMAARHGRPDTHVQDEQDAETEAPDPDGPDDGA